jgi:hypothetical protein
MTFARCDFFSLEFHVRTNFNNKHDHLRASPSTTWFSSIRRMIRPVPVRSPSTLRLHVERRTPPLTGPFSVGVGEYHVQDPARIDQDGGMRQFMVSAFYPAVARPDDAKAYLTDVFEPAVEKAFDYLFEGIEESARAALSTTLRSTGLQANRDAEGDRTSGPFPTLVYYPGGSLNRYASVDVCESLASRGYVVLAVDGPHDAALVVFPDGRLCEGGLKGDYISPGVGDVSYLLSQLPELARTGPLQGLIDTGRVGLFGHSRGGYVSNIAAFGSECVKAVASIDSFLWGYSSQGSGLEKHPPAFQATVRSTPKPVLRICGRPAGADSQAEAQFCLNRDGGDFCGPVVVVACTGWSHMDFATTPWACGRGKELSERQSEPHPEAGSILSDILGAFFDEHLRGQRPDRLAEAVARDPSLALATRPQVQPA